MMLYKMHDGYGSMIEVDSEAKFNRLLVLPKAIVYVQVNWSDPEKVSRQIVSKVLTEIGSFKTPVFKIDSSDPNLPFIDTWLINQRQVVNGFNYGGWGETLLIENGNITAFIGPAKSGFEKTKEIINSWDR